MLGNDDKIAQNVNADEGAVLGAAYYGAALSRQFKMKKLEVKENSIRDIRYYSENDTGATKTLFPRGTALGTKKTLSFPATGDFTLHFEEAGTGYVTLSPPAESADRLDPLYRYHFSTFKLLLPILPLPSQQSTSPCGSIQEAT